MVILKTEAASMPDWYCCVKTAAELDTEIRKIASLEQLSRCDEIKGALFVEYSDEDVKNANLVGWLEHRGVAIVWRWIG
jgi:hypothetical protein